MIHIILQIFVFQLLFLGIYELFFKRETFFNLNRIFLLISPLIAIVIPFLPFEFIRNQIPVNFIIELPEIIISENSAKTEIPVFELIPFLKWIWFSGIVVSGLILIQKFYRFSKIIKNGKTVFFESFDIIQIPDSTQAFSFLNRIFIGENIPDKMKHSIIIHEKVHIQEKHGWDLFYFEFLAVILWFNPLIYIYKNRIIAIHEFIADKKVVSKSGKETYYQNLLSAVFKTENISFVNSFFNQSLIKIRITMLQKSTSTKIKLVKYLFVLPLLGMMLTYSACSDNATEIKQEQQVPPPPPPLPPAPPAPDAPKNGTTDYTDIETVPFSVIDEAPVYPGCDGDNEERKGCMSSAISNLIAENFNTAMAKNLNLTGRQRIMVQFKIDDAGNVVDIKARAPHPDLETETIRTIKQIPKMEPGKQKGKPAAVIYSLPIIFEID